MIRIKREEIDIVFEDVCHFQIHGSRCKMWIPPEDKDPVVMHVPTIKSMSIVGAVHAKRGKLVLLTAEIFNADFFLLFLKLIVKTTRKNRKIIWVPDNARYHYSAMLKGWLS